MKKIGITTSIPVEVIFASGNIPVDLNNIFITSENPLKYIDLAESAGFPRSTCAWIKGMYSVILDNYDIDTIISVVEGDCSNTRALTEVLELKHIKSIPFSYPNSRDYEALKNEIIKLCNFFKVSIEDCIKIKNKLDITRKKVAYIDELTWKHNKVGGFENHIWQVSCSDFNSDFEAFDKNVSSAIEDIEKRPVKNERLRLGYLGVPPISGDLYDFIETLDARIVYNEVQRQFTMSFGIGNDDIVAVYRTFTYPYTLEHRLNDIKSQILLRKLDGIIHYTQAFCFRGIEDIVIKNKLNIPILTLEGDKPGSLDARTKLRIESFIEMLD